jgi:hypothetical protein
MQRTVGYVPLRGEGSSMDPLVENRVKVPDSNGIS